MKENKSPVVVIGTVVRVEIFDSHLYDIGVTFLDLGKNIKNEISQYIMCHIESEKK